MLVHGVLGTGYLIEVSSSFFSSEFFLGGVCDVTVRTCFFFCILW
jgi:hypothetical protein